MSTVDNAAPPAASTPSRLRLFASMMYEAVLLFGVVFVAAWLFDTLTESRSGLALRHLRQGLLFVAIGVYFIACWRRSGQTLPMKTWNIRLASRDGHPASIMRLLLRYVLLWPLPLLTASMIAFLSHIIGWPSLDLLIVFAPFSIFIWTWLDPERQFLHDRILGTRLINARQPD